MGDLLARPEGVGEDRCAATFVGDPGDADRRLGRRERLPASTLARRPLTRCSPPVGSRSAAVNEGRRPGPGDVGWPSARSASPDDSGEPLDGESAAPVRVRVGNDGVIECGHERPGFAAVDGGVTSGGASGPPGRVRRSRRERTAAVATSTRANGAVRSPRGGTAWTRTSDHRSPGDVRSGRRCERIRDAAGVREPPPPRPAATRLAGPSRGTAPRVGREIPPDARPARCLRGSPPGASRLGGSPDAGGATGTNSYMNTW